MGAVFTRGTYLAENDFGAVGIEAMELSGCELRECADPDGCHEPSPSPVSRLPRCARNRCGQQPIDRENVQVCRKATPLRALRLVVPAYLGVMSSTQLGEPVRATPEVNFLSDEDGRTLPLGAWVRIPSLIMLGNAIRIPIMAFELDLWVILC